MVKLLIFYSKMKNKLTEMIFSWIEIVIDSYFITMNFVTFLLYYITSDPIKSINFACWESDKLN